MARLYHLRDVLVRLWRLLHHELGRRDPDRDPLLLQRI